MTLGGGFQRMLANDNNNDDNDDNVDDTNEKKTRFDHQRTSGGI